MSSRIMSVYITYKALYYVIKKRKHFIVGKEMFNPEIKEDSQIINESIRKLVVLKKQYHIRKFIVSTEIGNRASKLFEKEEAIPKKNLKFIAQNEVKSILKNNERIENFYIHCKNIAPKINRYILTAYNYRTIDSFCAKCEQQKVFLKQIKIPEEALIKAMKEEEDAAALITFDGTYLKMIVSYNCQPIFIQKTEMSQEEVTLTIMDQINDLKTFMMQKNNLSIDRIYINIGEESISDFLHYNLPVKDEYLIPYLQLI